MESATSEERNQELSNKELDQVAGGFSLNFTKLQFEYKTQDEQDTPTTRIERGD